MLPFIALVVTVAGLAFFGLAYLWSITLAQAVDKRADLDTEARREIILMSKGYTPMTSTGKKVSANPLKVIKHMDSRKGRSVLKEVHRNRSIREFHRSVMASVGVLLFAVIGLYHLANLSGVLHLVRPSDARVIDPWRQIGFLSVGVAIMHAFVGMACQHHGISLFLLALHGGMSRVLFGFALFFVPTSANFWIFAVAGVVFDLIAFVLLWWHRSKHVAGNSSRVGYLTFFAIPIALIIHVVVLMLSYETYAVMTFETTVVVNVIVDVLLFLLPALYVLSESYYKHATIWPLLPQTIYADYGLGHYWKIEAKPDLVIATEKLRQEMVVLTKPSSAAPAEIVDYSAKEDVESGEPSISED